MARQIRNILPKHPYHIVQRGSRKQTVFYDENDKKYFLKLLKLNLTIFSVQTLAYCLMSNHYHLLLEAETETGISNALRRINSVYALRINQRFGWIGPFWQGRFYSEPAFTGIGKIANTIKYIENNPVRAKIVDSPEKYNWSSAWEKVESNGLYLLSSKGTEAVGQQCPTASVPLLILSSAQVNNKKLDDYVSQLSK